MNNKTADRTTAPESNSDKTQPRNYRPALTFYHANGKGTGSVASFETIPATSERDGAVFLSLAQQKSVASGSAEQGNRQHATFDWANRLTVKLNFGDLCQILSVLKGSSTTINDGKGLYHDNRNTTTIINLTLQTEPCHGHSLEISRRSKSGGDPASRVRILFNASEAYGLGVVLEQTLSLLAFGIPHDFRQSAASAPTPAETDEDETPGF